jgi:hypothetical protein
MLEGMTRLELLLEKRTELVNKLIELKTWQMSNPTAKVDQTVLKLEEELDELARKIERLRMDS